MACEVRQRGDEVLHISRIASDKFDYFSSKNQRKTQLWDEFNKYWDICKLRLEHKSYKRRNIHRDDLNRFKSNQNSDTRIF